MGLIICQNCQINLSTHKIKHNFKAIHIKKEQIDRQTYLRDWSGLKWRDYIATLTFRGAERRKWGFERTSLEIKGGYNLKKARAGKNR